MYQVFFSSVENRAWNELGFEISCENSFDISRLLELFSSDQRQQRPTLDIAQIVAHVKFFWVDAFASFLVWRLKLISDNHISE